MLNLFAESEHLSYARCARLYLQQMLLLQETHPWLHQQFESENMQLDGMTGTGLVFEQIW